MMPNEGRVAMLRLLCEQPMILCLFSSGPKRDEDFVSIGDFTKLDAASMIGMSLRDWTIDEEHNRAVGDKKTFTFTSTGVKAAGWYVMLKRDRTIVGFDTFDQAYPINSTEDKISVRPRIMNGKLAKGA